MTITKQLTIEVDDNPDRLDILLAIESELRLKLAEVLRLIAEETD